jgi:general secretion pathway protein G
MARRIYNGQCSDRRVVAASLSSSRRIRRNADASLMETLLKQSFQITSRRARYPKWQAAVQRGFTLVEVMVVVAILGILAALIVPKIIGRSDDARIVAAKQDVATLQSALKLYRLDNQRYPTTEQGLKALVEKPTMDPLPNNWKAGGYLDKLPKDPWGNSYQYLQPGVHGELDVFSFGADGQPGGVGNDADIGSWDQ